MRLIIRDGTEPGGTGGLEFDLPEVLAALGERALKSTWRANDLQYVSKDEQDVAPMEAMGHGRAVIGQDLAKGIEQLLQVIDGEFVATDADGAAPWVTVRAVDSSWWEVVSNEAEVHEAIRRRFRAVEEHEFDVA